MNKVTTINLDGQAYQFEEAGYGLLKNYLDHARKKLDDDPDKDEILADLERAIAEKCTVHLHKHKDVITAKEAEKIIGDMGPVEPAEESQPSDEQAESDDTPKRLYTLHEGAIIGGVANGLAAYFNIDVTIVRLVFVLLVFVSGGIWILIYLLMMVIVPEARTPEQKAELRGEQFSAQQVLNRAKRKYADIGSKEHWKKVAEQNRPALSGIGEVLQKVVRVIAIIIAALGGLLLGALTAAWISGLWWLAFGHVHLTDQLSTISLATIGLGMTAVYFIAALPIGVITSCFARIGINRPFGKQGLRWLAAVAVLWVVAIGSAIGVAAVTSGRISDYQSTHGYIDIDNHKVCINDNLCPASTPNKPYYYLNFSKPPQPPAPPEQVLVQ